LEFHEGIEFEVEGLNKSEIMRNAAFCQRAAISTGLTDWSVGRERQRDTLRKGPARRGEDARADHHAVVKVSITYPAKNPMTLTAVLHEPLILLIKQTAMVMIFQ